MRSHRPAMTAATVLAVSLFAAIPQPGSAEQEEFAPVFQREGVEDEQASLAVIGLSAVEATAKQQDDGPRRQDEAIAREQERKRRRASRARAGELETIDDIKRAANLPNARPEESSWAPLRDPAQRAARVAAFAPRQLAAPEGAIVPLATRIELLTQAARLRDAIADANGAHRLYERVIGLGGESVGSWRALGRLRARAGLPEAAEAAFLAALALFEADPSGDPSVRAAIERELGELYLASGWPEDAAPILEASLAATPNAMRTKRLWALALARSDGAEAPAELAAQVQLWPDTRAERWRARLQDALDGWLTRAPAPLQKAADKSPIGALVIVLAGLLALLAVLWLLARVLRSRGDLVVTIGFPDELEGLFSVQLSTQKGRHRRLAQGESSDSGRRKSTRWSHFGVSREAHFLRLPARRYFVTLHGTLRNPGSASVLTEPWEEQPIDVAGNDTRRLAFDVSPRECPVDVKVRWDKRRAGEVGVAARGLPQSLRYATNGEVRLRLPMGSHTVMVGSGDRVAECDVEVQSFQPTPLEIDLAGSETLVFKGCPPAVEPYLHGDLNGAARALRQDGHTSLAHLLLARLHQEQGQMDRAAEQLESAGHVLEAAKLRESMSDFGRAAALFEDAGNAVRAAETYKSAGDYQRAGELYESVQDLAKAAACFERAGATEALIGVMEQQGRLFDAAHIAREAGDRARAIRLLQQIGRGDPNHAEACMQLVEAFEHEGHVDLAANKLDEYVSAIGVSRAAPDLQSRLADLLHKAEEPQRALEVLEELRRREPTWPHIASRIETLRKTLSSRQLDTVTLTSKASFSANQRYEIIEEIGRGGMGLIFKARDRRLNRIIALKRLPENLREHPKALELFLNEAQAAARLNHPNIVTVYDTDEEEGTFFITMELLEGLPLNAILSRRGRLGPRDTARLGAQVARGLQYAHDRNVVHRDIKTANLFLTNDRVVKIMDFGLAKMMEEVRRGSTVIGGTPSYMAPEQATGDQVGNRADIYALGITIFELITGRVPFTKGDVAYHHRHTAPPDPRSLATGIPDALAELILQMIEKDPADRIPSASEIEHRLDRVVNGAA